MKFARTALWMATCLAAPAWATPFTGAGSPGALDVSNIGSFLPAATPVPGSASATPDVLTLVSGDDPAGQGCAGGVYEVPGPCWVQAVYNQRGVYSFNWDYSTADISAGGDVFGVLVDGVAMMVYGDPGGPVMQSGSARFAATTSFGWYINCTDCTGGAATVTISNFDVPEPSTLSLLIAGVAAAGFRRRPKPLAVA
jgi:PEP-CTERM motif